MKAGTIEQTTLQIGGMACSGCADTVQQAINNLNGVESATVDLKNESASVAYDADSVSAHVFEEVIDEAGYQFNGIK